MNAGSLRLEDGRRFLRLRLGRPIWVGEALLGLHQRHGRAGSVRGGPIRQEGIHVDENSNAHHAGSTSRYLVPCDGPRDQIRILLLYSCEFRISIRLE